MSWKMQVWENNNEATNSTDRLAKGEDMNAFRHTIDNNFHDQSEFGAVSDKSVFTSVAYFDCENVSLMKGIGCYNMSRQAGIASEFDSVNFNDPFDLIITNPPRALSGSYTSDETPKAGAKDENFLDDTIALLKRPFVR